jgi:molybdate transport system permease protein
MLAGNIPGRTQTMPLAIFSAASGGDMGGAILWVVLIVALSLAIIRLLNWKIGLRGKASRLVARARSMPATAPDVRPSQGEDKVAAGVLAMGVARTLGAFALQVNFLTGKGALGLLGASGAGKSRHCA